MLIGDPYSEVFTPTIILNKYQNKHRKSFTVTFRYTIMVLMIRQMANQYNQPQRINTMSDTVEKTIVLHEFTVWDNDISPCPEYYDKHNKTYYMNDHCSQSAGIPSPLYGKPVEIVKSYQKIHVDDVPAMLRKKLGAGYAVTRF